MMMCSAPCNSDNNILFDTKKSSSGCRMEIYSIQMYKEDFSIYDKFDLNHFKKAWLEHLAKCIISHLLNL